MRGTSMASPPSGRHASSAGAESRRQTDVSDESNCLVTVASREPSHSLDPTETPARPTEKETQMADMPSHPDTGDDTGAGSDLRPTTGGPRWRRALTAAGHDGVLG